MNTSHSYETSARWTGARSGVIDAEQIGTPITFSSPAEFGGQAGLWTPEHFLVAAVTSCYVATFVAIADLSKLEVESLDVSATGVLEKRERGLTFTHVAIRPILTIANESDRERALRLLEKAERSCLIARSIRSEVAIEPVILIQAPASLASPIQS